MRGYFITFEGGEGSGKSTHAATLAQRLKALGIEVVLTREPGGSTGAEIIRHILLSGLTKPLGAETEAILFAAARDDHMRSTILPALKAGKWVVSDRFIDSTRVYQGAIGNVDPRLIRSLERVTVGRAVPDLTFILDLSPGDGLARAGGRGDSENRFERFDAEFHARLRAGFLDIAAREARRCIVLDAARTRSEIADEIWRIVSERLRP